MSYPEVAARLLVGFARALRCQVTGHRAYLLSGEDERTRTPELWACLRCGTVTSGTRR